MFKVSNARRGDRPYWDGLLAKIHVELPAFLRDCLNRDLTGFDRCKVPQTKALSEQKLHTIEPMVQWWRDVVCNGGLPRSAGAFLGTSYGSELVFEPWPAFLRREQVRASYAEWCEIRRVRVSSSEAAFGRKLRMLSMWPGPNGPVRLIGETRPGGRGEQAWTYTFGSLEQHREALARYLNITVEQLLDDG